MDSESSVESWVWIRTRANKCNRPGFTTCSSLLFGLSSGNKWIFSRLPLMLITNLAILMQEVPCTAAPRTCFYNKNGLYACRSVYSCMRCNRLIWKCLSVKILNLFLASAAMYSKVSRSAEHIWKLQCFFAEVISNFLGWLKRAQDADWAVAVSARVYFELFPGSPAVCGHGNREFSFLARRAASDTNVRAHGPERFSSQHAGYWMPCARQIIIAFLAGGMCWDAQSCGLDLAFRKIGIDNDPAFEKVARKFSLLFALPIVVVSLGCSAATGASRLYWQFQAGTLEGWFRCDSQVSNCLRMTVHSLWLFTLSHTRWSPPSD